MKNVTISGLFVMAVLLVFLSSHDALADNIQNPCNPCGGKEMMPAGNPCSKMHMGGSYVDYSDDAFNEAKGKKRVLFFHAGWCPSCRKSEKTLSSINLPSGVVVFKVDYDNSVQLKKKYAVTNQDTFVQVDSKGKELTRWMGNANKLARKIK